MNQSASSHRFLADFGVSERLKSGFVIATDFVGSPLFMSPEVIRKDKYDNRTDIWSLGKYQHVNQDFWFARLNKSRYEHVDIPVDIRWKSMGAIFLLASSSFLSLQFPLINDQS